MYTIHYKCIHSYTHALIHSYTHTLIHSYTRTLIHSYTHTLVHSYTHTLIHSYTPTLIYRGNLADLRSCVMDIVERYTGRLVGISGFQLFTEWKEGGDKEVEVVDLEVDEEEAYMGEEGNDKMIVVSAQLNILVSAPWQRKGVCTGTSWIIFRYSVSNTRCNTFLSQITSFMSFIRPKFIFSSYCCLKSSFHPPSHRSLFIECHLCKGETKRHTSYTCYYTLFPYP